MNHRYEIDPRPAELGGGWQVRLLEGDEEVGGGVFPPREAIEAEGIAWWNGLQEAERAWWLEHHAQHYKDMTTAAGAYAACLRLEAYDQAQEFAEEWLGRQG
jgi:hypothetical protein